MALPPGVALEQAQSAAVNQRAILARVRELQREVQAQFIEAGIIAPGSSGLGGVQQLTQHIVMVRLAAELGL